jgi:ketosteroid isomerase-like protein
MRTVRLIVAVPLVIALGCAHRVGAPEPTASAGSLTAVRAARARWNAAVAARDTTTLTRLAADSILQTSPFFVSVGRDRYIAGFAQNMARRLQFGFVMTPEQLEASAVFGPVLATEYGHWRETWLEQDEPTEIRGTYYAVWRERDGAWEIVREAFAPQSCTGQRYCSQRRSARPDRPQPSVRH